ncbi:MAG TPA: hypothetical protein VGO68_21245 [Pyrinomonadaceae bacterium]|nr:hypothetical protein [Pyrinomonadaceae bacterium]
MADLVTGFAASNVFYRFVSLRYDFPDSLHKLFSQDNRVASFELTPAHFPYLLSSRSNDYSRLQKLNYSQLVFGADAEYQHKDNQAWERRWQEAVDAALKLLTITKKLPQDSARKLIRARSQITSTLDAHKMTLAK